MTGKPFTYSIIQFRGDPVRQEALNIGVAVLSLDGSVEIKADPLAFRRISGLWPHVHRRLLATFVRDLRHSLRDSHQLMIGEAEAGAAHLQGLCASSANQVGLTAPRTYYSESLKEAATTLFGRFVDSKAHEPTRDRHLSRSRLRTTIQSVLETWVASTQATWRVEPRVALQGSVTSHQVDIVAFDGDTAQLIFFATPMVGETAALIRDSLPTIVRDLGGENRGAKFVAVLGDTGEMPTGDDSDPISVARKLLKGVAGLEVLTVPEFREEYPGMPKWNASTGAKIAIG